MKLHLTEWEKEELRNAEKNVEHPKLQRRIHVIQMKWEWIANKDIEKMKWISHDTVSRCIKRYRMWGLDLLLSWKCAWRKERLSEDELMKLKERGKKWFTKAAEAQTYIAKHFGKSLEIRQMQRVLKKLNTHTRKQVRLHENVLP